MPSTDRRPELKEKDIDGSDRFTAGCVLIDLASPGVSQTSVYAKGLTSLNVLSVIMYSLCHTEKFKYVKRNNV